MESALVLLISLLLVQSSTTQLLRYVKSNDLSSQDCPGQPCLTLDQYIHDAEEYFATGKTFIFLDGQHTLERTVYLTSVSDITLTQEEDYFQIILTCMSEGALVFKNTSNVTIKGLVFISQSDIKRQNSSLLSFVSSRQIRLLNVIFQGNGQFRAIYSNKSFITIVGCHFEDNIGDKGGALYAEDSVIMLNGNNFTQNKATKYGGAICALKSSISIFNSTDYNQGNEMTLTDNLATIFLGNEVPLDGGAIYMENSTLTMSDAIIMFANNSAHQGGAVYCHKNSVIYSSAKNLQFLSNIASGAGGAIMMEAMSSLYFGNKINSFPDINSDIDSSISVSEVKDTTTVFSNNHAEYDGGAVFLNSSTAYLSGKSIIFDSNTAASDGGALKLEISAVVSDTKHLNFSNNVAGDVGGAIASLDSFLSLKNTAINFGVMECQNSGYIGSPMLFLPSNSLCNRNRLLNLTSFPDINIDDISAENITSIFSHNHAEYEGGAVYLQNTTAYLSGTKMIFDGNSAEQGGALMLQISSSVVSNTEHLSFNHNVASKVGGAIASINSFLSVVDLVNKNAVMECQNLDVGSAIFSTSNPLCNNIGNISFPDINIDANSSISAKNITAIFSHNHAEYGGGAIFLQNATAYLSGTDMIIDSNTARQGGALMMHSLSAVISNTENLSFSNNVASNVGGAIVSLDSYLILGDYSWSTNHYFINNSGGHQGGAIYHHFGLLAVLGNSLFTENHANDSGGAIWKESNNFRLSGTVLFTHNHAKSGGAIILLDTSVVFTAQLEFRNNSAKSEDGMYSYNKMMTCGGGAISSQGSQIIAQMQELKFIDNFSGGFGGAIYLGLGSQLTILSAIFIKNKAKFVGGAIHLADKSTITISGSTRFDQNSGEEGGAVYCTFSSVIRSINNTVFSSNKAKDGGAIYGSDATKLMFDGLTIFDSNKAEGNGGGIYGSDATKFMFAGLTIFDNNIAEGNGGGIYTTNANITFNNTVQFSSNSAQNGGAMFLESGTILVIEQGTNFTTSYNHAVKYGGVIYHMDSATARQCEFNYLKHDSPHPRVSCFIYLNRITTPDRSHFYFLIYLKSYYDSAGKDGSYIYGGLMDKCEMPVSSSNNSGVVFIEIINIIKGFLKSTPINNANKGISSKPYQLCFCQNHNYVDCFGNYAVQVYRGQKFNVSLVATAQGDVQITSSTQVIVKLNPTARHDLNQSTQVIKNCSAVTYNVYSTEEYEELVVYPADGPCFDRGLARAVIEVTLLPCPDGFMQSSEQCVCEERLQAYDADCTIDEMILITKRSINFWMSARYINESYQGLILYKICPIEYCKSGNVSISLEDVNFQCDFNRTGILCGACATNYSLLLGSSTCQICSNMYLSLLVPFALAGLGLVVFLTFLRLTVATGLINSLILYANIVQANKSLFFPPNTTNLLTVFVAWMNLDLGFKTCFYHGMDGYAQTWLQFAFPLYVWILISAIIISSRYSIKVSRLIGSNPIAVLATLLLLSYTKILKIIIEVFSSVKFDYPDNNKVTVWLKDANVPYMEHKHLILTVATFCVMISFFLPYTLLLLLGYKLYSFRWCRKYFHCWLMRFRPLLDSYYAPYNIRHRYWTGLMLLVRCALYMTFSYYSLGEMNRSLLAIIVVFVPIGFCLGFMRVYKKMFINIIEVSTCFNLILLSAVTLADIHSPAVVYTLVGTTFCTFISVCVYHLHFISYIQKIWLIFRERLAKCLKRPKPSTITVRPLLVIPEGPPTETVIDAIREPLLEN